MSIEEFFASLNELHDEPLVIADPVNKEARGNLCMISISSELAQFVTTQQLVGFFHEIMKTRQRQLREYGNTECMTFYVWVDEQAGQLRFSLISGCNRPLPFGAPVDPTATLEQIVASFLTSPWLDGIPLEALHEPAENHVDPPLPVVLVYVACLQAAGA